ncbi:hypothetical protein [Bradyrhizobium sp. LMG 9283]
MSRTFTKLEPDGVIHIYTGGVRLVDLECARQLALCGA